MHSSDGDSVLSEPLGPDTLEAGSMVSNARSAPPMLSKLLQYLQTMGELSAVAGKLISLERSHLGDGIIEATECLKAWWDSGIIKQLT
jgi:hypothetical protein